MTTLKIRLTLLATIAGAGLVALLPTTASPFLASLWSDRTKKDGIVPVEW
jgi:hypothetical protein